MASLHQCSGGPTLAALPPSLVAVLAASVGLAHTQQKPLWLVGGVVRDVLAGWPLGPDLDLVVEGDALALAYALAHEQGGRLVASHEAFGTATVALPRANLPDAAAEGGADIVVDLAMARTEHYPFSAALPVVRPARLAKDLARRDFSINAMALEIVPSESGAGVQAGAFLDPFNGQRDLEARLLRVLHDQSFNDDPTRIVRGLRLAARHNLHFDNQTLPLLEAALVSGRLEATSPERLRAELCLALEEPHPDQVLQLADTFGITPAIFPPLQWHEAASPRCACAADLPAERRALVCGGLLTYELTAEQREELIARYRLPGRAARVLRDIGAAKSRLPTLAAATLANSQLDRLLHPLSEAALDVLRCAEPGVVGTRVSHYRTALRPAAPLLDGHALQAMGVPPGPQLGRLLAGLRAARLDGLVESRADEEAWVVHYMSER